VLPLVSYVAYASVTDDDRRRQTPTSKTILLLCPVCRRASNNALLIYTPCGLRFDTFRLWVYLAPKTFNLDIALMKLVTPVKLNDAVNLVCLPSTEDTFPPGTECLTAGWGHSEECK